MKSTYRIRYKIEVGQWHPTVDDSDRKPIPGVRILKFEPDMGYTDNLVICSLLRNADSGAISSSLWCIDPALSAKECGELVESLEHHLEEHHNP